MRILAITDLRGATERLSQIEQVVKEKQVGVVVFSGNIVPEDARANAFRKARAAGSAPVMDRMVLQEIEDVAVRAYEEFFHAAGRWGASVLVVPGFLDAPERLYLQAALNHEVVKPNVHMIHRSFMLASGENLVFAGFGGGVNADMRESRYVLTYPEWEVRFAFDFLRQIEQEPVLVFHTPPRRDPVDREWGKHVGQPVIETLIKEIHPRYAFCGSALEGQGLVEIGPTKVIHPGPLREGFYALVDTLTDEVLFESLPQVEMAFVS